MTASRLESTTCLVAGAGPAGMVLALLLARAGIDVTVMEKHPDFLRDFRGDTVHPTTLRLLDDLGLSGEFAKIPHRVVDSLKMTVEGTSVAMNMGAIPGGFQHMAMVPQWDLLELLARAAVREPSFHLMRNSEVLAPIRGGAGRVCGVRYRDEDGAEREMRAALTVGCDGRTSTLRAAAGFTPKRFGVPIDVWWLRLPRKDSQPAGLSGVFQGGEGVVLIDRGDYYQIAYLIAKGTDEQLRSQGIETLRERLAVIEPALADDVWLLSSFDDVKLLSVEVNRLRKWFTDGLLFIGDAAHAMSPVGGIGINLAINDAIAAARLLAGPLQSATVTNRDLTRVQARRWIPTVGIQRMQITMHKVLFRQDPGAAAEAPWPLRKLSTMKGVPKPLASVVAYASLPERTPDFARRSPR